MKIYLAGTSVSNPEKSISLQKLFINSHKLHSFFHSSRKDGLEREWFLMNYKNKVNLFLDSGAFSALTQGVEINIYDYINFIKQHQNVIKVYANLDVIGTEKNAPMPNAQTAKLTLKNQKIMEKEGLTPLPVFHIGEPKKYLEYYVENYNYIGLGGMVGKPKNSLIPWLNRCFGQFICDKQGMPKVKVHGFGVTSLQLLLGFPWWSVDSTSWVATARVGQIYMPRYKKREWVYNENSWKIVVSNRGGRVQGDHIDSLPPRQRKIVLDYIYSKGYKLGESKFKKVPQYLELKENERWAEKKPKNKNSKRLMETIIESGICNTYQLRDELNIIYFQDLEKFLPKWPWVFNKTKRMRGFL